MSHFIFFFMFLLWAPLSQVLKNKYEDTSRPIYPKLDRIINNILFWGVPALFLFIFFLEWDNTGMLIFVGIIWALLLAIHRSGDYIHRKKLNIARIEGRLVVSGAGISPWYARFQSLENGRSRSEL
jgi:hypothetical protein